MTLDFPTRVRELRGTDQVRQVDVPLAAPSPAPRAVRWIHRHRRIVVPAVFVIFVLGFSGAWTGGALVLDGPAMSVYLRLMINHLGADHRIPYWMPELWVGAPLWVVTPLLPLLLLLPVASAVGPDVAVKAGTLAVQVVGAWGAFVLARSLWRNVPAAIVAGILFSLQPLLISLGALAGSQPSTAVIAAAPWLAWSLRRGLRGDGPAYVALAGLLAGISFQMQSEYAFALVLLGGSLLAVEIARTGTSRSRASTRQLVTRSGAVVGIALGVTAYWLLPFAALGKSFVLSPPELVQGELFNGGAAQVGRNLGVYFSRAQPLTGAVGYDRHGLLPLFFHMGWVCLALTLLTIAVLPRKDRDGTLTAILLSSVVGIWLSTGAIPAASSGPASRGQWLPFVLVGVAVGIVLGTLVRPLQLGRWTGLAVAATAAFLVAVPYLTPFVTLQHLVPLFANIRFPRFYAVAPLGLALGGAYPVVLAQEWAENHRARSSPATLGPALAGAVALTIVGVFLVDVWPYRTYYRIHPPPSSAAYDTLSASLAPVAGDFRLAPTKIEPEGMAGALESDHLLTTGWPHFVASKQVWRLTAEPFLTPDPYRERAYALSSTAFQVTERTTGAGTSAEKVPSIDLAPDPLALPMVRAYAQTVALATDAITPELAVGLAQRNVGVVTGSPSASAALKATTVVDVASRQPCADNSVASLDPALASQIGVACGLHTWLSTLFAGVDLVNVSPGVGAVFRSTADRLQGVSVYLDRVPDRAELTLYDVAPDGRALGAELAQGKAVGVDENGLTAFTFDPVVGSAGKQFAFVLSCPDCAPDKVPRLVVGHSVDQPGDLLEGGTVRLDRSVAYAPIYDPVAASPPSTTRLTPNREGPGNWKIGVAGADPSLVVVAEAWFPGWEAEVDGHRAPVLEADGAFLGVPVGAGSHVVTLRYHRPAAALAGRAITFATLLTLVLLGLRRRRSTRLPRLATATPRPPRGRLRPPGPRPGPGPGPTRRSPAAARPRRQPVGAQDRPARPRVGRAVPAEERQGPAPGRRGAEPGTRSAGRADAPERSRTGAARPDRLPRRRPVAPPRPQPPSSPPVDRSSPRHPGAPASPSGRATTPPPVDEPDWDEVVRPRAAPAPPAARPGEPRRDAPPRPGSPPGEPPPPLGTGPVPLDPG